MNWRSVKKNRKGKELSIAKKKLEKKNQRSKYKKYSRSTRKRKEKED